MSFTFADWITKSVCVSFPIYFRSNCLFLKAKNFHKTLGIKLWAAERIVCDFAADYQSHKIFKLERSLETV